jgi:heptosyltransferase-3
MTDHLVLPARPKILVVTLRRLGDVLLTTPLIRSLRRAWPDATIGALVFADTAGILEGNPDLDAIVAMPVRPTLAQSLAVVGRLWRRYDLAIATQPGDRPTFFAWAAGQQSIAPVADRFGGRVKRRWLDRSITIAAGLHRGEEVLALTAALGIAPVPEVVAPQGAARPPVKAPYAVLHAAPMFRYKQWTGNGWRKLAEAFTSRGLGVVATGGPSAAERRYLDEIWRGTAVERFDGRLGWAELTALLTGARIYVGPDTSVTHLAAATGCPTVALYGPTDPRLWAPWPAHGANRNFVAAEPIQQRGNVVLVQNPLPCLPCQLEGCERRLDSYSWCLDELSVSQVLAAVDQAMAGASSPEPPASGWRTGAKAGMEGL